MRKETLLAILAGISIGLIFAFGSWKLIKNFRSNTAVTTPRPSPKVNKNLFITLDKLNDFDVITDEQYRLTGLASPSSKVVVITQDTDYITDTDPDGSFEMEISFPSGLSQVKIRNFDNQGQFSELVLNVVFSTEFLKDIDIESESNKKAISYVGAVTDISGDTIQIKDPEGEIKQASVADETTYINALKKNIEVKSTDLAIGDYVVVMGFINGNKVLNAKRIVISSPLAENKHVTIWGKIEKLSKTKMSISNNENEVDEITLPKKWNGPDIKELEVGQTVIVIGAREEDTFSLRTIFTPVE